MQNTRPIAFGLAALWFLPIAGWAQEPATSFSEWVNQGRWHVDSRYRLEHVEQSGFDKDALASTLRLQGAFETSRWNGLSFLAELEMVETLGDERFNSTTNDRVEYPVVPDPDSFEVNRAYFYYRQNQWHIIAGRQQLPVRQERFLGTVDFRQNQQTYDALMIMHQSSSGLSLAYGYMDGIRRFLGEDNPVGDVDMNAHLVDAAFDRTNGDVLTLYAHLLDMETPAIASRSHRNIGIRYEGSAGPESLKWLYHAEYADQASYADGANSIDAYYVRAEIGARFGNQWVTRLGVEQLSGNGTYAFQTPFATGHDYNGRADLFAAGTPPDGLLDQFIRVEVPAGPAHVELTYHQFDSDQGNIHYGDEIDVVVSLRFKERFEFFFEYADYRADDFAGDKTSVSVSLRYQF